MSGHGEKKTRRWEQAIAALLSQGTLSQAAQVVGIDERTLRRWMREPEFKELFHSARADLLQQSLGFVAEGLVHGALVLRQILRDPEAGASAKVAAVRLLYDLAFRDRDIENLESRLAVLEAAHSLEKSHHA